MTPTAFPSCFQSVLVCIRLAAQGHGPMLFKEVCNCEHHRNGGVFHGADDTGYIHKFCWNIWVCLKNL